VQREHVWVLGEVARSEATLAALRARIDVARKRVQHAQARAGGGVASEAEVDEERQALVELEAEARLAALELERLEARLGQ